MARSLLFPSIALFWVVMNVLLWRAEFGGLSGLGGSVPPGLVIEKILTAPDDSGLEIRRDGRKIGHLRWQASPDEGQATGRELSDELPPEGMVRQLSQYTIRTEGNLVADDLGGRFRFEAGATLTTNLAWRSGLLRLAQRPVSWELQVDVPDETLRMVLDDGDQRTERAIRFEELRDPVKLLASLGAPVPPAWTGALGLATLPAAGVNLSALTPGLRWEARQDWAGIGRARVRAYRLEARLLDKYAITILVSRVGEILRAEFPGGWVLVNDAIAAF